MWATQRFLDQQLESTVRSVPVAAPLQSEFSEGKRDALAQSLQIWSRRSTPYEADYVPLHAGVRRFDL